MLMLSQYLYGNIHQLVAFTITIYVYFNIVGVIYVNIVGYLCIIIVREAKNDDVYQFLSKKVRVFKC